LQLGFGFYCLVLIKVIGIRTAAYKKRVSSNADNFRELGNKTQIPAANFLKISYFTLSR
jgi:hypothetical protein